MCSNESLFGLVWDCYQTSDVHSVFLVDGSGDNDEEGFFTDQIKIDMGDEGNRHFKTVNRRISASPRMNIPP